MSRFAIRDGQLTPVRTVRREAVASATREVACFDVPGAAARFAQARVERGQVVFLCDMYLGGGFVLAQLQRHGMMQAGASASFRVSSV